MPLRRPIRQPLPFVLLALLAISSCASAQSRIEGVGRIVALSDVHGAYEPMQRTLRNASVIDDGMQWIAGDTHLVIVGDLLDRGAESRRAMDLLMALEPQAEAAGGRVHVVIGNHEAMNLIGDMRYVSSGEFAAFAAEETVAERDRWFSLYAARSLPADAGVLREKFDEAFPVGFFAHRRAFAADGRYGGWLLEKPLVVVINDTAFVHGGLSPMIGELGLARVNGELRQDLVDYVEQLAVAIDAGVLLPTDSYYDHPELLAAYAPAPDESPRTLAAIDALLALAESPLHALDGPLWYRGNVACSRLIEQDRLQATLAAIGAGRVVVGHTPTPGRQVLERMGGRLVEIDTGMLGEYYRGRGHALIIVGDILRVVSEDSAEPVAVAAHPRQVGARPGGFMTAAEIETLLADGEISDIRVDELKRRIVTVTDGQRSVEALFAERERRGFYPDVAAYRLDRLLELDLVPVTVERKVDGDNGSLSFLPVNWVDEPRRAAAGQGGSASCPLSEQWQAMYAFDVLIHNEARSLPRMLYSPDQWQLILVGHQNAFSRSTGRPRYLESVDIDLGPAWMQALISLSAEALEEQLGDVLDKRRREALLERRDEMVYAAERTGTDG